MQGREPDDQTVFREKDEEETDKDRKVIQFETLEVAG
jgi:hypothetical protein